MSVSNTEKIPPVGMRFHPSDKEKFAYLLHKVTGGLPLPWEQFVSIRTVDLYGSQEPWELFETSWNHENHFFTKIKKVVIHDHIEDDGDSLLHQRICRDIGHGKWERIGLQSKILDSRESQIGFLDNYVYRSTRNAEHDGKWFLKQYTLADDFACCYVRDEYVDYTFCTVTNKTEGYEADEEEGSRYDLDGFFKDMLTVYRDGCSSSNS